MGVHPTAVVDPAATVGAGVSIGGHPWAVFGGMLAAGLVVLWLSFRAIRQALADAALTEFAAAYGLEAPPEKAVEGATPAPPPAKEMGPEKQG